MRVAERTSKQAPPPGELLDALVDEHHLWWVSVEGEGEPRVLQCVRPGRVTFASPFLWRPRDVITLSIEPFRCGSRLHLVHLSDEPFTGLEAAALRHRWGEHIDRDLRTRFDQGGSAKQYAVSLYRGDVDDWTIVDRVLDRSWRAIETVPVPGPLRNLGPGDVVWAEKLGRHRTSVGCAVGATPDLQGRPEDGSEIWVPLPEFGRRLQPA